MSSIYRSQFEIEAEEELHELEEKKVNYGWTRKDAERYEYLSKELNNDI